jgi:hypothetical protein
MKTSHEKWLDRTNKKCAEFMLSVWKDKVKRKCLWPTTQEKNRVKTYIKKHTNVSVKD